MTIEIKRIPVGPVAKISFVLYFVIVFIGVLIYSTFMMSILSGISGMLGDFDTPLHGMKIGGPFIIIGGLFGAVALAAIYTVITVVLVLVYNAIASYIGGVQFEYSSVEVDSMQAKLDAIQSTVYQSVSQAPSTPPGISGAATSKPGDYPAQ